MKALNNEELEKVVGGALTSDAKDWLEKYGDVLKQRAKAKNLSMDFTYITLSDTVYNLEQIKTVFSMYINIDDLK